MCNDEFDDDVDISDGIYAVPSDYKIQIRRLVEYCKSQNKDIDKLTEEEIKQFVVFKRNPLIHDDR